MNKIKEYLNESSLSRVWKHMKEHDSGTITAFRDKRDCGNGKDYVHNENLKRNKSLLAKLQSKGYSITRAKGQYIENYGSSKAKEVGETVFLVVDIKDNGNLQKDLIKLGLDFEQDSILFMPKGGTFGTLIGTNKCPDAYPGFNIKKTLKNPIFGDKGVFFTRVNGRPFTLKEGSETISSPEGYFGKWGCYLLSNRDWNDITDEEIVDSK
jgi:hypothetical protein